MTHAPTRTKPFWHWAVSRRRVGKRRRFGLWMRLLDWGHGNLGDALLRDYGVEGTQQRGSSEWSQGGEVAGGGLSPVRD
jgi:hypothetical protein